ncbi:hypothetical protein LTS18_003980 [Coniosporium uncinatum]|uniref:Uncharacterized protein n=1 Tax=Coniosporium uncinatum TaxID=93489 RepID=A0ACC3DXT8_9PEZI|nr:hypothetical protein LTS18_003980 [Coniosporium uncinatum]
MTFCLTMSPFQHVKGLASMIDPFSNVLRPGVLPYPQYRNSVFTLSHKTAGGFLTLHPGQPHRRSSQFRRDYSKPYDPVRIAQIKRKMAEELQKAWQGDVTAGYSPKELMPWGMGQLVVGKEYVLRVHDNLKVTRCLPGTKEELLARLDAGKVFNWGKTDSLPIIDRSGDVPFRVEA